MSPTTLIPATRGQLRAEGDKISELSPSHTGFTVTRGLEQDPFCANPARLYWGLSGLQEGGTRSLRARRRNGV